MSDHLTRAFRAQLTTAMEAVLRTSVLEITKIFESSLHDFHMELAQKGNEIAQLKVKLERTEPRPKMDDNKSEQQAETAETQGPETQLPNEDALNGCGQTSSAPKIDFEAPDNPCAPLGSESLARQAIQVCPSIRLRQLSIPLWPIPVINDKVVYCDEASNQTSEAGRKCGNGSPLSKSDKASEDIGLPKLAVICQRLPLQNDMKNWLRDIKEEYAYLPVNPGHARSRRHSTGTEQENVATSPNAGEELAANDSASEGAITVETTEKTFSCKYCEKVFDTEFGFSTHVTSHKRCQGCKKDFPFPRVLRHHKAHCRELKSLLVKEQSTDPEPACDEDKTATPAAQQANTTRRGPSSDRSSASLSKKRRSAKMHICRYCKKKFGKNGKLMEHVRIHTGEKPFPCSVCSKTFRLKQALKEHTTRRHKKQFYSEDLAWTEPLEELEDNEGNINRDSKGKGNGNNAQRGSGPDATAKWQTMGTQCANGFICLLCTKRVRNKQVLIEHYRVHTGERPLKCERCPKTFRTKAQLYVHKKRCRFPETPIVCEKCGKHFSSHCKLSSHMYHFHKFGKDPKGLAVCRDCGKVFPTSSRLKKHIDRLHK